MSMPGGYQYESPEARRLGGITPQSYDYRDQTKVMSKLVNDVSYMAGMQRKMQKGIDDANQNFIQQLQSLVNDVIVILGGGGDTGLDFGDLKYILQAIGALFGFQPGMAFPINLFGAAWHFFSNYILPVGNFEEAINVIVDGLIASVLDLFGEVPIVGEALQQLAVVITEIRDLLLPVATAVQALFDSLNFSLGDVAGIGDLFGPFRPIFEAIMAALDDVDLPDFSEALRGLIRMGGPLIDLVVAGINTVAAFIRVLTGQASVGTLTTAMQEFTSAVTGADGLDLIQIGIGIIEIFLSPTGLLATLVDGLIPDWLIPNLDASIITTGLLNLAQLPAQVLTSIGGVAASLINGVLGLGNIPTLPQGKIADLITDLAEKLTSSSNIDATKLTGIIDLLRIPTGIPQNKIADLADDLAEKLTAASSLNAANLSNLANIPAIAQSKITNLVSDLAARLTAASNIDATKLTGIIDLLRLPTGIPQANISSLTADLAARLTAASSLNAANLSNLANIPAIAQSKITNLVSDLAARLTAASNIDATKLTGIIDLLRLPTGIPQDNIASLTADLAAKLTAASDLNAAKLTNITNIPAIAQSKITNLVTDLAARLTAASNIDATKLTGIIDLLRLPTGIPQGNIASLTADLAARLTSSSSLNALNLINTIAVARLPSGIPQANIASLVTDLAAKLTSASNIDATKLTGIIDLLRLPSGIPQSKIASLTSDLGALLPKTWFDTSVKAGSNLVFSPDMEDTSVARNHYSGDATYGYSTEQAWNGTRSYKWTVTTESVAWKGIRLTPSPTAVYFGVKEGETYQVGVRFKAHESNGSSGEVRIFIRWRSSTGTPAYTDAPTPSGYIRSMSNSALNAAGTFVELAHLGTCPAGYDLMEVMALSDPSSAVGNSYYVDGLEVREVTESQNIIQQLFGSPNLGSTILDTVVPVLGQSKIANLVTDLAAKLTSSSNIDATKLTGIIDLLRIPTGIPQDNIASLTADLAARLTAASNLDATKLINTINAARIPTLAQSKITNLVTDLAARLTATSSLDATKLTGIIDLLRIPTGIPQANISDLAADLAARLTAASDLNAAKLTNITNIPAIAQSKITNLVTDLAAKLTSASNIDATKLTGIIDLLRLPTGIPQANIADLADDLAARLTAASSLNAANLSNLANIPAIAQSKITNLVSDLAARLTSASNIDATKLTGIIDLLRLPTGIPQGNIASLTADLAAKLTAASSLNAANLTNVANIPAIAQSKITNLVTDLAAKLTSASNIDATKLTGIIDLLRLPTGIPQDNIASLTTDLASKLTALSNLDATKLINTINVARIPNLAQSKITNLVTDLAAKLTSTSSLDATKLTGLIDLLRLPSQVLTTVTGVAADIINGVLDPAVVPPVTKDMSPDLQIGIDAILNALRNTPGVIGQSPEDIEDALFRWPTDVYNVLAGQSVARASVSQAKQALNTLQGTITSYGQAITNLQAAMEGANGFREIITFKQSETVEFSGEGAFAYDAPLWSVEVDRITLPPGGGGMGGNIIAPIHGEGGDAGQWVSETLVRGTHYPSGPVQMTGTIGARGTGGGPNLQGGPGGNIVHDSITGGKVGFTAPGGAGGNTQNTAVANGDSPGDLLYRGNVYPGGTGGASVSAQNGYAGGPGAGGGGGAGGTYLVAWRGGAGGIGKTWFTARAAMPSTITSMGNLILPGYRLNTGTASTDAMTTVATWSKVPLGGAAGGGIVFIRANTACTYYVYLRVWYVGSTTYYAIGRVSGGVAATPWKTGTIGEAIPFNAFGISSDDDYNFTVTVNGSEFDTYEDSGHSSAKGAGYRSGGYQTSDANSPGSIIQLALFDSGLPARTTSATVATAQATASHNNYINLATVGPAVTINVPESGEVLVTLSADIQCSTNIRAFMGFEMSGANTGVATDAESFNFSGVPVYQGFLGGSRTIHKKGLNPGATTFTAKYKTSGAAGTFSQRTVIVDPKS